MAELPVPGVEESQPHEGRAANVAKVEPVWKVKHTMGSHENVVPHEMFNRTADELVAEVKRNVEAEAEVNRLRAENEALTARLDSLREVFAACEVEDERGGWRIGGAHLQAKVRAALAESPSPGPEERAAEIGWDGASCSHCRSSECDGIGCGPGPGA